MGRTPILATASCLLIVVTASANTGPPRLPKLPVEHKLVEPVLRFEGVDKYPDWVFHLNYTAHYTAARLYALDVPDSNEVQIKFNFAMVKDGQPTIRNMTLVAMERKVYEERQRADAQFEWLDDTMPGVLTAKLQPLATSAPVTVKEIPTNVYRVFIKYGKLSADRLEDLMTITPAPAGLWPSWVFGIVSSLSFAWLGIWFARRGTPAA